MANVKTVDLSKQHLRTSKFCAKFHWAALYRLKKFTFYKNIKMRIGFFLQLLTEIFFIFQRSL